MDIYKEELYGFNGFPVAWFSMERDGMVGWRDRTLSM